jgi:hypothetical protein
MDDTTMLPSMLIEGPPTVGVDEAIGVIATELCG